MRPVSKRVSFRELLDMPLYELPDRPLRPVGVAVLDSGIDASHEALRGRVVASTGFDKDEAGAVVSKSLPRGGNNDPSGHGTGVASVIAAIAPNARIMDFRVLDADARGWGEVVLDGLERAIRGPAEIINVSIAIGKDKWWGRTAKLLEEAYRCGKIVVASKRNFPRPDDLGIPAELPTAISVDAGMFKNPYFISYFRGTPIEFSAHGEAVLTARTGGGWTRLTGSSFATPVIAALCALMRGANPELTLFETKTLLKCWAGTMGRRTWARHRSGGLAVASAVPPNPLETAPSRANSEQGRCLVAWTCPRCGAAKDVPDAFPSVRCERCGAVCKRDVLLEPRAYFNELDSLRRLVPPEFSFHNAEHARDMVEAVYGMLRHYPRLAVAHKRELLFAALLHDCRYADDPENHEEASAAEAAVVARAYGCAETFVEHVVALIRATRPSHTPVSLPEKIIRDADLFHIGTPSYFARSAALRAELAACGQVFTDAGWRRHEAAFLTAHRFHLPWLERERRAARAAAIRKLNGGPVRFPHDSALIAMNAHEMGDCRIIKGVKP